MPMQPETMLRFAAKAIAAGGKMTGPTRVEWDCSGNCTEPVGRDIELAPATRRKSLAVARFGAWGVKTPAGIPRRLHQWSEGFAPVVLPLGMTVGLTLKCRKCENCRKGRRRMWSFRAQAETGSAYRTWFGTLTLSPEQQFLMLSRARLAASRRGLDLEALPYAEAWSLRVNAISSEITRYLKRVRKQSGAPLRYLWVCESHKSGNPHFHCLIHEITDKQVTYRQLSGQWHLGFTKMKLVEKHSDASYLTKYLSKSTATRVRASVRYGKDVLVNIDQLGFTDRGKNKTKENLATTQQFILTDLKEGSDGLSSSVP